MRSLVKLVASAVVASGLLLVAPSQAQVQAVIDRQCSWVNITDDQRARFAASVGIMTTDSALRQRLFSGFPDAAGSEMCASAVSQSFCNEDYFGFVYHALTNLMATNAGGSAFFTALDVMDSASAPSEDTTEFGLASPLAALGLGIAGYRGNPTGGSRLGDAVGGAVLGFGAVTAWELHQAFARCNTTQEEFTAMTELLVRNGLRGLSNETRLVADMRAIAASMSPSDAAIVEGMIEAMSVTADRIASSR